MVQKQNGKLSQGDQTVNRRKSGAQNLHCNQRCGSNIIRAHAGHLVNYYSLLSKAPSSLSAQEKPFLRISRCLRADASPLKGGFSDEELLTILCLEAFFVSFVALWCMFITP